MRLPLLALLLFLGHRDTVTAAEPEFAPANITECGLSKKYTSYLECHVDAACLYGARADRKEKMLLRRYYEAYHGKKNLTECATVIVVRATPPAKEKDRFVAYKVRAFNASGWINSTAFETHGVRFVVGQKIVMLHKDDGFTDDDDWLYTPDKNMTIFPIFNGTFNYTQTGDGKTRIALDAKAYNSTRGAHYADVYVPRYAKAQSQLLHAIEALSASIIDAKAAAPATSQLPMFPIVMGAIGAITLAGVAYMVVLRVRRYAGGGQPAAAGGGGNNGYAQLPVSEGRIE